MSNEAIFLSLGAFITLSFFGVLAWKGCVTLGRWTLLDRRTRPLTFWVFFFVFLALVLHDFHRIPDMLAAQKANKTR